MKNRKTIAIVSLIVGLILAAGLITLNVIQNKQVTMVYMTTHPVNAGAYYTDDDIKAKQILKKDKLDGYIDNKEDIVGKIASVDLVANDIISKDKVSEYAENTDNQFLDIPSGKQAISFSVSGGADSVSNKLKVGDIIRIYNYQSGIDGGTAKMFDTLKYVRVASITSSGYQDVQNNGNDGTNANISDTSSETEKTNSSYSTITVIVTTKQAQDIIKIEKNGGAYVTLISRGNPEVAEQLLAKQDKAA